MQTYTEAESNANLFAWTGFVRRGRETSDFRTRRAKPVMQAVRLALPRREPYLCRRQNIRRSRGRHGLPCRSRELRSIPCWNREASVLCEGGKCYGFTANWFTFLDRTDNGRAGNAGRMTGGADSAIPPSGKVLRFHGKSIHFPWSEIGLSSLHLSYGILERSLPGKVGKSTLHDVGCQECPNIKPI